MANNAQEAFIVDAVRTPIGKRNGSLSEIHAVDLLGSLLKSEVSRLNIPPENYDDLIIGCVSQVGEQAMNIARNSWLSSGLPESVPGVTIDRQCGSSLQAASFGAFGIMSGMQNLVLAGGVESMSRIPLGSTITGNSNPITLGLSVRYRLDREWFSQARGAEIIATRYGLTRDELDEYSYTSHIRATAAMSQTRKEMIPVEADINGDGSEVVTILDHDEGIRTDPDLEKLKNLKPAFPGLKMITAGNASQISDGASLSLLASADSIDRFSLKPRGRVVAATSVGVDPVTMLTGPIPGTAKVLEMAGMDISEIDLFEVNEAFAPVVLAWQSEFEVSLDRVNVHGGAIALGHPLGATGTRILSTLINTLEEKNKKYGLIAICEGGGLANSMIIERI
ncbi:MAG: thiolase family protein [Candidatus Thermoplasmatota archaeon]|nr:thiolase family protein [Candidatus Thermoplasmatota archaeon]